MTYRFFRLVVSTIVGLLMLLSPSLATADQGTAPALLTPRGSSANSAR